VELHHQAANVKLFLRGPLVPVPPSKTRKHPDYDDRLLQILTKLGEGRALDIRELVVMAENVDAAHLSDHRRSISALFRKMRLDRSILEPTPTAICVFDDVLTTGAPF
jgi:predicted amidophosphoribosyltransferase